MGDHSSGLIASSTIGACARKKSSLSCSTHAIASSMKTSCRCAEPWSTPLEPLLASLEAVSNSSIAWSYHACTIAIGCSVVAPPAGCPYADRCSSIGSRSCSMVKTMTCACTSCASADSCGAACSCLKSHSVRPRDELAVRARHRTNCSARA